SNPPYLAYNGAKSNRMGGMYKGYKMVNRPRDFRHHDVVRAFRAARAAGVENPSVRIRVPSGTEYYVSGGAVEAPQKKSTPFAKGGGREEMFGKGDRTRTSPTDAAGKQQPGGTGHRTGGDTKKLAKGGEIRAVGGMSRPARGGECGT